MFLNAKSGMHLHTTGWGCGGKTEEKHQGSGEKLNHFTQACCLSTLMNIFKIHFHHFAWKGWLIRLKTKQPKITKELNVIV